jgi:uncharacterized protein YjbI with pentapeptide repeats
MDGAAHPQLPREVLVDEVLKKIADGEDVEYSGVTITGNLDLREVSLPKDDNARMIVTSKICINNSVVNGDVNFDDARFERVIGLCNTTFQRNTSFFGSQFANKADLYGVRFLEHANFKMVDFQNWVDLSGAVFSKGACFDYSESKAYLNFSSIRFMGPASFEGMAFDGYTDLTDARFEDSTSFFMAVFSQETRFDGAWFMGIANFNESRFKDYVYFTGTSFKGPVSLNNTKVSNWMIDWSSINDHLTYNEAAYQGLMQMFWVVGEFRAYDDCYYQYRWQRQSHEPMSIYKVSDFFAWISCGYGVKPLRPLGFGLSMIMFFGIIFWRLKLVSNLQSPNRPHSQLHETSPISAFEEAMYFSIMMFLTRPPYGLHPAERWRYLIIIEYISGWLTMALFLVTLARLIVR